MTDRVRDTIWFRSPDGGEVKMVLPGYPPEEVTRLIRELNRSGWKSLSRKTETLHRWSVPKKWYSYFFGLVSGLFLAGIISFMVSRA